MVGYVFGVGYRHSNNTLMDKTTGEAVHIDFGIAFEQGKNLPVPERVPFRLTLSIIDGTGKYGTDSVFRRTCHTSLHVLLDSSEHLLTVPDVLIDDPSPETFHSTEP